MKTLFLFLFSCLAITGFTQKVFSLDVIELDSAFEHHPYRLTITIDTYLDSNTKVQLSTVMEYREVVTLPYTAKRTFTTATVIIPNSDTLKRVFRRGNTIDVEQVNKILRFFNLQIDTSPTAGADITAGNKNRIPKTGIDTEAIVIAGEGRYKIIAFVTPVKRN